MASQLTPVVITDKNGRITTVHRKNAKLGKAKAIPAPKRDFTVDARKAMATIGIPEENEKTALPNFLYLAEHDPKLLSGIVERCLVDGVEKSAWMIKVKYRDLFSHDNPSVVRYNLEYCRGLLELYPVAERITQANKEFIPGVIEQVVQNTLDYGERFSGGGYDLLRVAMIATAYINEDDQHSVIFTHWKRLPEMIELIPELAKRGKVDEGTLEMLLDSETTALREGEL